MWFHHQQQTPGGFYYSTPLSMTPQAQPYLITPPQTQQYSMTAPQTQAYSTTAPQMPTFYPTAPQPQAIPRRPAHNQFMKELRRQQRQIEYLKRYIKKNSIVQAGEPRPQQAEAEVAPRTEPPVPPRLGPFPKLLSKFIKLE